MRENILSLTVPADPLEPCPLRGLEAGAVCTVTHSEACASSSSQFLCIPTTRPCSLNASVVKGLTLSPVSSCPGGECPSSSCLPLITVTRAVCSPCTGHPPRMKDVSLAPHSPALLAAAALAPTGKILPADG